jgi:hypothetical protein
LCAPNHATCNSNNTPVVCSTDGLGYVNDATPCGSRLCVSGACQTALFADDFEDADFAGWQAGGDAGWSITTAQAAASTRYSLRVAAGGVSRTFAGLKPKRVSWWVMAPSDKVESGQFVLTSTAGQDRLVATSYFNRDGTLVLVRDTESVAIPFATNQWYHIELRNVDWTAKTFDYYVNDTQVGTAIPFQDAGATSIGRLNLAADAKVMTGYWDQITFD